MCVCMYGMYVCMSVCMYVCMYVGRYVRTYVCMYVCMYACTYARTYVRMYVCTYVSMYGCTDGGMEGWMVGWTDVCIHIIMEKTKMFYWFPTRKKPIVIVSAGRKVVISNCPNPCLSTVQNSLAPLHTWCRSWNAAWEAQHQLTYYEAGSSP